MMAPAPKGLIEQPITKGKLSLVSSSSCRLLFGSYQISTTLVISRGLHGMHESCRTMLVGITSALTRFSSASALSVLYAKMNNLANIPCKSPPLSCHPKMHSSHLTVSSTTTIEIP